MCLILKCLRRSRTFRIYRLGSDVNKPELTEGRLPEKKGEVALDNLHAFTRDMKVGDEITLNGRKLTITGFVALPNYSSLFKDNADLMFEVENFGVGLMSEEGFDAFDSDHVTVSYAWRYSEKPETDKAKQEAADVVLTALRDELVATNTEIIQRALAGETGLTMLEVSDFLPEYENKSIQFAGEDMNGDQGAMEVFLYIVIAVLAFIVAVTTINTLSKEAGVIGTLRASGFTRGEMVRHYMILPLCAFFAGMLVGNVLGYTGLRDFMVNIYREMYSLGKVETFWNADAFVKTTLIPSIIMVVINAAILIWKLRIGPLQFLRRDLKKNKRSKALRLPRFRFLSRFRLRVLLQNLPGYLILFVGICFVMLMMAMAVGMPDSLAYYKDRAPGMIIAPYETILKSSRNEWGQGLATDEKSAEKFIVSSMTYDTGQREEDIEAYGIDPDSSYIDTKELRKLGKNEVLISHSFAGKFKKESGDTIRLHAKYEDKTYTLKVKGIDPYEAASAVFMPIDESRDLFDMEEDDFSGWFSEKRIKDIDQKYILNEITAKDITKMVDQLDHSLGSYMVYFQYMCIALSVILMYLLTKLIIERNENAISMTKILGYSNREISSVYITATTIAVLISECVAVFIGYRVMSMLWKIILKRMNGWFDFIITKQGIAKMLIFVLIGYLIVMIFDFRRIRRIPMDQALKNVE